MERRKRGKVTQLMLNVPLMQHSQASGQLLPKTRDGMIESLRVLKLAEKQQYRPAGRSPDYPFKCYLCPG